MSEQEEQERLAAALDASGLLWTATANGGRRSMSTGLALKRSGVKPGVPDILIFTPSPLAPQGAAIELKRVYPTRGAASPQQVAYIERLNAAGINAAVAWGAEGARDQLIAWGYQIAPLSPLPPLSLEAPDLDTPTRTPKRPAKTPKRPAPPPSRHARPH
jgi:hypothetical protein